MIDKFACIKIKNSLHSEKYHEQNQGITAQLKDSIYKTDTGLQFLIHKELWQKTNSLIEK